MIRFEHVTVTYAEDDEPTLRDVDLTVEEGELCLVIGRTGVGKSTLLGAINGLVPHFTGGRLAGRVTVDGRDTRTHPPRDLADVVGVVGQDPLAGFVTDTVEEELAYAMEQLALPPATMRRDWHTMLNTKEFVFDASRLQGRRLVHGHVPTAPAEVQRRLAHHPGAICLDTGCVYRHNPELRHLAAFNLDTQELTLQPNIEHDYPIAKR